MKQLINRVVVYITRVIMWRMCEETFETIVDEWVAAGVVKKNTHDLLTLEGEFKFTSHCLRYFVDCATHFQVLPYPIIATNADNLR